jgi:hypothetical protein
VSPVHLIILNLIIQIIVCEEYNEASHYVIILGANILFSTTYMLSEVVEALGTWVRIALKAWMSVCVYSVCR